MKKCLPTILALFSISSFATTRYVATAGVDTDPGTFTQPYRTITKAVSSSVAGDTIYLRGGSHTYSTKINISKSGTAANRFYLLAYPGEKPILDFSAMAFSSSNRGLDLSGNYWTCRGIDFYKAGDNGMFISGAYNTIILCNFYENQDTGLQLANGANNNQVINCDSYFNVDPSNGNADGYAAKLDVGTGNSFKGCRAWQNSDDGWDGLLNTGLGTNPATTYDSCWCFMNGYLKSGAASTGNGNGFKMGGNNERHDATLTRCLSAFNRVKGFDQNNDKGSMILYNCTGYKNNPNFGMNNSDPAAGEVMVVKNCVSFAGISADAFRAVAERANNSWQSPFVTTVADFVSVDSAGLRAARKPDGSLPDINFMHLANGSDLINGGLDIGLPFTGTAPDLGAFETDGALPVKLMAFNGVIKNNNIILNWSTATEVQNNGWEIERSMLSGNTTEVWQKIGFVPGRNNSSLVSGYTFTDAAIATGNTYLYRLKQLDNDGHIVYSHIITLAVSSKAQTILTVFPNPVKDVAILRFSLPKAAQVTLYLYNEQGQIEKKIIRSHLAAGAYSHAFNATGLATGRYIFKMSVGDEQVVCSVVLAR